MSGKRREIYICATMQCVLRLRETRWTASFSLDCTGTSCELVSKDTFIFIYYKLTAWNRLRVYVYHQLKV